MFDISFSELFLIGIVALVVIGPERLPKVARTVGHLLGRAQRYVNDVKGDIQREVELEDLRKMKEDMESAAHSIHNSFQDTTSSIRQEIAEPLNKLREDMNLAKDPLNKPHVESLESTQTSDSALKPHNPTEDTQVKPVTSDEQNTASKNSPDNVGSEQKS